MCFQSLKQGGGGYVPVEVKSAEEHTRVHFVFEGFLFYRSDECGH